mmetsp:Transcript_40979/g.87296  ORF Transcript_40979/g.87296 Transcript_40979/m.87296 type:complete len:91 (+) Transcript_40979:885-1157(+)
MLVFFMTEMPPETAMFGTLKENVTLDRNMTKAAPNANVIKASQRFGRKESIGCCKRELFDIIKSALCAAPPFLGRMGRMNSEDVIVKADW